MGDVREWLGDFHFSRATRHLARDFSDAVLLAELLAQLVPPWVELHNYSSANRVQHKLGNWEMLNRKVLVRIKCEVSRKQQEDLANAVPGAIETLLALTAKDDAHKACFKGSASVPRPKASNSATHLPETASGPGLKSPKRYSTESRPTGPYSLERRPASPSSPRKVFSSGAASLSPKSPRPKRPSEFSLDAFLSAPSPPSPPSPPGQDDIAVSFSQMLQLMSANDSSRTTALAKPKAAAPMSRNRHPLTPDNTPVKLMKATVTQKAKPAGSTSKDRAAARSKTGVDGPPHGAKIEFGESALVYFCRQDEPLLLQVDNSSGARDSARSRQVKMYVSTPHFIECSGSQLRIIQNMKFDANEGKWKWHGPSKKSTADADSVCASAWKQSLVIDIAPNTFAFQAGPRTEPVRKSNSSHLPALTKRTSHNSHFFTEALSRIKCNSISLEDPVAIIDQTRNEDADATLCPDFAQSMHDAVGFDAPLAPTVFPKVHADVLLDIPEKKSLASPTRAKKSNADAAQAT
ncbi:hypothetical protein PybrP1_013039 [[Pythium] brassicae (nom. inval.)]|nr:hypothetical protein PybrP1_013039 [[Pythium] brassicae (nom. inval.)]